MFKVIGHELAVAQEKCGRVEVQEYAHGDD
jgi:hypothetical protein